MQVKTYLISEGVKYTETIIQDGYINKIWAVHLLLIREI